MRGFFVCVLNFCDVSFETDWLVYLYYPKPKNLSVRITVKA